MSVVTGDTDNPKGLLVDWEGQVFRADPEENVTYICHQITMENYKLVTKNCLEIELANTTTLLVK